MATPSDIRQRIYNNLYGSFPTEAPFVTTLTATYTDAEGVIDVLDEDNWAVGDVMENTATGELMKVLSVTTDGSDIVTVSHGWAGTSTAAAASSADVLYKNPRFTQSQLDNAVTAVLLDLGKWGIHVFGSGTITRADPKVYYELSETDIFDPYGVLKVYTVLGDSEIAAALPFRYQHSLGTDATEYGQGRGIHLAHFGDTSDGDDEIIYIYAQVIEATTDLLSRQEELVVAGATANLMGATIVPATHDPGARSDRTTPPGQTSRDVRHFQGRFFTEARLEAATLSVERQKMLHEPAFQTRARRWVN
jgi:hypothetical protein